MPERQSTFGSATFLAITASAVLLVALGTLLNRQERVLRTSSGCIIKLERYHFRSGVVRYYLLDDPQERTLARGIANDLPQPVTQRLKRILPAPKAFMSSDFPNEPFLSVAFSTQAPMRNGRRRASPTVSRVTVSDDHGQAFDRGRNEMGNSSVLAVQAFPRRGKELYLRPMIMGQDSGVVFKIPNPCPGPHPVWKAEPLPISATNSTLQVTLTSFVADNAQARTCCVLQVREDGHGSTSWMPVSFEVSDATGNHWKPMIDRVQGTNGLINCSLWGALWPEEDAWKLHVELKPAGKQATGEAPCVVEFLAKPEQVGSSGTVQAEGQMK